MHTKEGMRFQIFCARFLFLGIVAVTVLACQGVGDGSAPVETVASIEVVSDQGKKSEANHSEISISAIDAKKTPALQNDFDQSNYSKFVYFHQNKNRIVLDYNFFPEGSDFDSQNKTVALPCAKPLPDDGHLNINLNAASNTPCKPKSLDVSDATFTLLGLEFEFDREFDLFAETYGFVLTADGFVDSESGELFTLPFSEASLDNLEAAPANPPE